MTFPIFHRRDRRASQLQMRGFLMNDNGEPDYVDFIRGRCNGFLSVTLPIEGGTELVVKIC